MKVEFPLTIGDRTFILSDEVASPTDFFKKLSFYMTIPSTGPNGETDLVIQHRVADKQYDYYSIVSKKADQEFKFGQLKDVPGALFAKGWEPIYRADNGGAQQVSAPAQAAPIAPRVMAPAPMQAAPIQAAPAAALPPRPAMVAPQLVQAPAASAPVAAAPSQEVQSKAQSVLARFNIGK